MCAHVQMCACAKVCLCACVCPYVCVHMKCVQMCTVHMCTYMQICACANVHICMCACACICKCVCARVQLPVPCGSACVCACAHTCEKRWERVPYSSQGLAPVRRQETQSNLHNLYPTEAECGAEACLFVPAGGEWAELGSWEEKLGHPGWVRGTRIKPRAWALFCSLREAAGRFWAMKQTEHNYVLRPASVL